MELKAPHPVTITRLSPSKTSRERFGPSLLRFFLGFLPPTELIVFAQTSLQNRGTIQAFLSVMLRRWFRAEWANSDQYWTCFLDQQDLQKLRDADARPSQEQ